MNAMRRVIIESPFAGALPRNIAYTRACMRHSLSIGEAPFASHLLYPQAGILRDEIEEERALGMAAGLAWAAVADATVVYEDLGISPGMRAWIADARKLGRRVEYCKLPEEFMRVYRELEGA